MTALTVAGLTLVIRLKVLQLRYVMDLTTTVMGQLMKTYFNPQSYGGKIEKRLIAELGLEKVPAGQDRGDARMKETDFHIEIKASLVDQMDNFNFLQFRLWQNVDSDGSKAVRAARTIKLMKTATRLASTTVAKIVPGDKGLDLVLNGKVVAAVYASGGNQSLILGNINIVDINYEPGKLSVDAVVDRSYE